MYARRVSAAGLPSAACLLAGLLFLPDTAAAQPATGPFVEVRGAWAMHLAGLVVRGSEPIFDYGFRLEPTAGFGLSAGVRLGDGTFGLRLDFDELPRADLRQGTGPLLQGGRPGPLWWLVASLDVRPPLLCGVVCVEGGAGFGAGRYPFDYDEVRDDIVERFLRPQTRPAFRFGLALSTPLWVPGLALYVSDYVSVLRRPHPGQKSPTTLHVLVTGVAFAWHL